MKKLSLLIIIFCSSILWSGQAVAVSLSLNPSSQTVLPGTLAQVTVNISGLSVGEAPSLGAFDIDVNYRASILSFQSVVFGPFLGNEGSGEALTNVDTSIPGIVDLDEISLLLNDELDALQPDSFPLAFLLFSGSLSNTGVSPVGFTQIVLSDAAGAILPVSTTSDAVVQVAPIPEPATIFLFGTGLAGLLAWNWRKKHETQIN